MPRHGKKNMHRGQKSGGGGKKPPLTHFLCIPLVNATSRSQLEISLDKFKQDVQSSKIPVNTTEMAADETEEQGKASASNSAEADAAAEKEDDPSSTADGSSPAVLPASPIIPDRAIRPIGTLHLTLGVMSLQSEEKVSEAVHFLQTIDMASLLEDSLREDGGEENPRSEPAGSKSPTSSSPAGPVTISITSLTSMHPAHKTSILYASPNDPTNRLLPFCSALLKLFRDAEYVLPDDRPLKLHATIVNTIYAKSGGRGGGHGPKAKAPIRLDARGVLGTFRENEWAKDVRLEKVAICRMGAKKILDRDGEVVGEEYEEVAAANLP